MNNKRQTIWLVSMLSLMVILSAYYLFTSDVTPVQKAGNGTQQPDPAANAAKASGSGGNAQGVQVTEVDPATGSLTNPGTAGGNQAAAGTDQQTPGQKAAKQGTAAGKTDTKTTGSAAGTAGTSDKTGTASTSDKTGTAGTTANGGAISPTDATVLNDMTNLKGSQYIDELQRQQLEQHSKRSEDLSAILADTKNHTQDQASKAYEELAKLDDTDSRVTRLEEKLLQDYDNAVVTEEATNFKVVVQSAKLEKKQAVQIIDMATKELNVTPDRLSVQYVP